MKSYLLPLLLLFTANIISISLYPNQISNSYNSVSDPVDGLVGSFAVSATGGATYSIPIDAPQGVGGLQPALSIVYNSQSGNGIAGSGCNVSGFSAITRASKDIYHDGTAKGLTYSTTDAFYLDGQRLIYSSGTQGQEGAVYYLESDPFTKIIVHGTYNSSKADTWFEVQASNGMVYQYGATASGRQSYSTGNTPRINAWYLDYVEDPLGNFMNYTYNKWNNYLYPVSITYGKNKNQATQLVNKVTFTYESRNDATPFVIESVKGQMSQRLKSISTYTDNTVYRTYEMQYNTTGDGGETKFSRLVSVTPKNASGESLKPVTLNWNFLPSFYQSVSSLNVAAAATYPSMTFFEQGYTSADFNGDGFNRYNGYCPRKNTYRSQFMDARHVCLCLSCLAGQLRQTDFYHREKLQIGCEFRFKRLERTARGSIRH